MIEQTKQNKKDEAFLAILFSMLHHTVNHFGVSGQEANSTIISKIIALLYKVEEIAEPLA